MEKILRRVFDYQRFSSNRRLVMMIAETQRRYQALDDDELFQVTAAGDIDILNDFQENNDAHRSRNI